MPKIKSNTQLTKKIEAINPSCTLGLLALKIPNSDSEQDVSLKLIEQAYPQFDIGSDWDLGDIQALNKAFEAEQLELDDSDEDYYRIGEITFVLDAIKLRDWRGSEKYKGMKRILHFLGNIELLETGDLAISKASELPACYLAAVCKALADLFKSASEFDD
jgi:hypothetical protein